MKDGQEGHTMSPAKLQDLLQTPTIEDIVLSSRGMAWFDGGNWSGPFESEDTTPQSLKTFAQFIAERAGFQLGLTQPSLDAYLELAPALYFRAHVVSFPMTLSGPEITLRRLSSTRSLTLESFQAAKGVKEDLLKHLHAASSILVAGATGSGKSSLVHCLLTQLPSNTRMVILEDSPELPLPNALSTKLICRNDRFGFREGATWTLSDLVFESLRMRPDRLILGECRGPEAQAIANALQTGHRGLMSTLHAGSATEALHRFSKLCGFETFQKEWVPWDLIVYLRQHSNGSRHIEELIHTFT